MKAIVYHEYGPPDVLKLEEIEKPTPKDDEVLIKVHAASVNSWDLDLLKGDFTNRLIFGGLRKPKLQILGCDVAGQVEAVGADVKRFQPGDAVFGDISACGWGAFAEYVCARENALTLKPTNINFAQAAAMPQAGLLALQGLRDKQPIQPGQKVLINGAGGGVGTFAIQMAKVWGAEVTGVDSTQKLAMMRTLGADHVLDYTQTDFTRTGQHYDLILDVMARRSLVDYQRALCPTGMLVIVGGSMGIIFQTLIRGRWFAKTRSKKFEILMHKPNKDMALLIELFEAGKVVPTIGRSYPLAETAQALRALGAGQAQGKIIITVVP